MEFSLLYFSGDGSTTQNHKYQLLLETAKFADCNGFSAVWIPERHFHAFGGLYPNPSVIAAALAMVTENIQLRSGSVVLPLQHPVRVVEEWAVVDNLSNGRAALSFAPGWHADDFLLAPENYANRKAIMWDWINKVKLLWQGEQVEFTGGGGNQVAVNTFPRPLQTNLPIWVTAKADDTFIGAGKIGANILTSLLYETTEDLAAKISLYRDTLTKYGYDPTTRKVALMLHTFIDQDMQAIKEKVRQPFCQYLNTHFDLIRKLAKSVDFQVNPDDLTASDRDSLLSFAFERYFNYRVMIGTPQNCRETIAHMQQIGVDEIACMIDFGVDLDAVMSSLDYLNQLKAEGSTKQLAGQYSVLSFFG